MRPNGLTGLGFREHAALFVTSYAKEKWPASHRTAESVLWIHVTPLLGDLRREEDWVRAEARRRGDAEML